MTKKLITKELFLKDVAKEVKAIKKHANNSQIKRLNFEDFDPDGPRSCIYGQMTGHCASPKAKSLMDKCCVRVFNVPSGAHDLLNVTFSKVRKGINGPYKNQTWAAGLFNKNYYDRNYSYLSCLEGYILMKGAKNEHIIAFLQDKVKTLVL